MANDLLLEVGAEEIPASFVVPALGDLRRIVVERFSSLRLSHGEIRVFGTPRRLALYIQDVAEKSENISKEVLGPSVRASFDSEGKPTRAAEKFAEGQGVKVEGLKKVQTPKGEYLAIQVEEKGRLTSELLPEILHAAVHGINFKKSMRWGDVDLAFARPVHWIVALWGEEVIPVVFGDVRSGRRTRGHRFLSPEWIDIRKPADYELSLQKVHVVADIQKRRILVEEKVRSSAQQVNGTVLKDEALLDQVTNLVEAPHPVVGTFDRRHLDLPPEVLVQEMKSHQRYFSVVDSNGQLLPSFIAVSNTPVKDVRLSLRGYERVLQARLSDGRFFFDEDRRKPLVDRLEKLHRVVWQGKLGSYAEKVDRFRALAVWLAKQTGHTDHLATVERAATLAKADLVTGMVGEFPELQGVMGREYARADGEPAEVALAIYEHYLPRFASDALPTRVAGALIGVADRLDSLVGIFAIGKIPTGAADPFGLRRSCLAIIHLATGKTLRFSLGAAIDESLSLLASKVADLKRKANEPSVKELVLEFFRGRLKALWSEEHRADLVEAVLSSGFDDVYATKLRLHALNGLIEKADFVPLATAFRRVANIVEKQGKDVSPAPVDASLLKDPAEVILHSEFTRVQDAGQAKFLADDYEGALKEITSLKPAVDAFFDKVMVMTEEKTLRDNRIRLLVQVGQLFNRIADFSRIQVDAS